MDFSRSVKEPSFNGLLMAYGVTGMMEARNYRQIEKFLPFIREVVDRVLHQVYGALLTSMLVPYADFVQFLYFRDTAKCWTSGYLIQLPTLI